MLQKSSILFIQVTTCGEKAINVTQPLETNEKLRLELFGDGCCRFDDFSFDDAKYRGRVSESQCFALCNSDKSCMAADMTLDGNGNYECWTFEGTLKNLRTLCDVPCSGDEKCYAKLGQSSMCKDERLVLL